MSATTSTGLISTLPASPPGGEPELVSALRREATARLHEAGFPGKKHERWRFTSVREVVDTRFTVTADDADVQDAVSQVNARLGADGTLRVVLVDGRPTSSASAPGVRVLGLAQALRETPALLEPVLGRLAPREHFAALNAAMFDDGVLVHLEEGAMLEAPVHLVHFARASSAPRAAYPRVAVVAGANSQGALIETFLTEESEAKHLTNGVTEVSVGPNARLDHTRLMLGAIRATNLAYLAVRQERDSFYASRVVTLGGGLSRLDLDVRLLGAGAEVLLDGAYHVDRSEHVDHQIMVEHAEAHGTSETRYRGLLDGKGHAVFNAEGLVRREGRGANVHQENRNLLLSDDAIVDTKPHLEIETDEVKASHGSTIGAVDDRQLFYLRSRGIPESEARDVLTFAFVREIIERIPHEATARRATDAVLARLPSGERVRELLA
jgi:Fe-S cluster assembly protein SufD